MNTTDSSSGSSNPVPGHEQEQEQQVPALAPLEPLPATSSPAYPDFGIEIVTPDDASKEARRIKNRQRVVLELLITGVGVVEAGKLANVHRSTIHRWLTTDDQFKAALSAYQSRTRMSARNRMLAAADEAAELVVHRMRDGDLRAALALLRGAGTLDPSASLTKELDAEPAAPKQDSATAGDADPDVSAEARVRELLAALSLEESTRLLQALAQSSQPKLPERGEKIEEPEKETPGEEPEAEA